MPFAGSVALYCDMAPHTATLPNRAMLARAISKNSPPTWEKEMSHHKGIVQLHGLVHLQPTYMNYTGTCVSQFIMYVAHIVKYGKECSNRWRKDSDVEVASATPY